MLYGSPVAGLGPRSTSFTTGSPRDWDVSSSIATVWSVFWSPSDSESDSPFTGDEISSVSLSTRTVVSSCFMTTHARCLRIPAREQSSRRVADVDGEGSKIKNQKTRGSEGRGADAPSLGSGKVVADELACGRSNCDSPQIRSMPVIYPPRNAGVVSLLSILSRRMEEIERGIDFGCNLL